MENKDAVVKWAKTAVIASLGGGFAAAFTAAMDPSKYRFPNDLGSGKLWPIFFQGAGLIFVGLLLKSPLGKQVMGAVQDAKAQATDSQAAIEQAKADLKAPGTPPPAPPPRPTFDSNKK
jgi:hypothetical protein